MEPIYTRTIKQIEMEYRISAIGSQWFTDDLDHAKEIARKEARDSQAWAKVEEYVPGQMKNYPSQQVFICTFYDGKYEESESVLDIKQPKRPKV